MEPSVDVAVASRWSRVLMSLWPAVEPSVDVAVAGRCSRVLMSLWSAGGAEC